MSINQLPASSPARPVPAATGTPLTPGRTTLLTGTGAIGLGYTLSWIAGLTIPAPSPALGASGRAVVTAYTGHEVAGAINFLLSEGLPAIGIAVVSIAVARAAGGWRGRVLRTAGLIAAVISLAEFALGLALVRTLDFGTAHALWAGLDRADGVKMLTFAVLGAVTSTSRALPRWLRYTGATLAATMTVSGTVYLLLMQSLAIAAGPALLCLLVFITGAGITVGAQARQPKVSACRALD
jgi:hypothetical protein